MKPSTAIYDSVGRTYSSHRQSDPYIADAINNALVGCYSVLNVGAGPGSYEPAYLAVTAVEPSRIMIDQRPLTAAKCIRATAEDLPFPDRHFDAVLGVMTVHHWRDLEKGLRECVRVARMKVVILTTDMSEFSRFWLFDYLPELFTIDRAAFPSIERVAKALAATTITPVPIPRNCRDGFLGAYWQRPAAYLDPTVRASISTFAKLLDSAAGLRQIEVDVRSGEWSRKYQHLLDRNDLDLGYRLVTATVDRAAE